MQSIFETPLWTTKISNPEGINELVDKSYQIKNSEDSSKSLIKSNAGNSWHSETNFLGSIANLVLAKDVIPIFNKCASQYGYNIKEANISYWTIITSKYGYNRRHNHPGSLLSAVLYLRVPEKSGRIIFSDPRPGKDFEPTIGILKEKLDNKSVAIDPIEGLFIIFPSYLEHEVEMTYSDKDRIIASFNITPLQAK